MRLPAGLIVLLAASLASAIQEASWGAGKSFTSIASLGSHILDNKGQSITLNLPFAFPFGSVTTTAITAFSNGLIQLQGSATDVCCPAPAITSGSFSFSMYLK